MNKFLLILFVFTTTFTYSQQKEMKGFGKLQLGMTRQQIDKTFKLNTTEEKKYSYGYLRVTNNLIIENVRFEFKDDRLVLIRCDYSEHLNNGLSQVYGQENRYSTSRGVLFKYKTNSSYTTCVALYNEEIIIYDNRIEIPILFYPALKELNKVEGFGEL